MSNSTYNDINSDEETDQLQTETAYARFKRHRGQPIKRKVVDVGGRLGSLYDTRTDKLVDRHSVQLFQSKRPNKRYVCQIFSGDSSTQPISFLEYIGFDALLRQHIRQQTVTPSGISRLIEYTEPINRNTRLLYYAYRDRQDKLSIDARKADRIVPPPSGPTQANYMITKIIWGFEMLCVIQTANNQIVNTIDPLLNFICDQLKNNHVPIQFNNDELRLINQLNKITVFGTETCIDDPNTSLLTMFARIQNWQRNSSCHQPVEYMLQSLKWLYGPMQFKEPSSPSPNTIKLKKSSSADRVHASESAPLIQAKLKRIDVEVKDIGEIFCNLPSSFASSILNERLKNVRQHYRLLRDRQEQLQERIQELTADIQRQRHKSTVLENLLADPDYQCLHEVQLKDFRTNVERLLAKSKLIQKLENDQIEYINALDVCTDAKLATNEAIDNYLQRSFSNEPNLVILWYSGDRLQREQEKKWNEICRNLTSERQKSKESIRLYYVDFSQCTQRLENFVIVRLPEYQDDNRDRPGKRLAHSLIDWLYQDTQPQSRRAKFAPSIRMPLSRCLIEKEEPDKSSPSRRSHTPPPVNPFGESSQSSALKTQVASSKDLTHATNSRTEINVLLLGETGVGKSTFINAFVNYLKFETLEQAERDEPVVLIPGSFIITLGDKFDECIVRYGNADPNEDHEHEGQSVTQHCKSYIFDLNDQISLRIIDTPGFGDIRGETHDMKHMDHILTYINTLPYLNAVCLFLKPNVSRLNVFFRSCIHQLLTYLTPTGYQNVIFCFTNTRSTFYAPGDTSRLLRDMLNQERLDSIPFKRDNTFCFDNQAFRYLAARRRGIDFDDHQKLEYKNSWNTSVAESIRLLKFIQTCEPYYLEEWQSSRKAKLVISMLARPLMETLRLIIYNWQMTEAKLVFNQLILNSRPVDMEICTHCATTSLVERGPFWITQYQPPILSNNTNQHQLCRLDGNDFLIEGLIHHELVKEGAELKTDKWQSSFHNFLFKCDQLQHFLRQQGILVQDDPFAPIIERFLEEEAQIAQIRNINSLMNRRVREILQSIQQIRQQNSQRLFDKNESLSVRQVYEIIEEFMHMPTVKQQVDCIKKTRQLIMSKHEHRISANSIKNKMFT